jgi:rod shape-determining protein MreC
VPRNRAARTAVLGASVRRTAQGRLPPSTTRALRRRLSLGALVLAAVLLITVSFREDGDGPVSSVQHAAADVVHPLTVAADRVAQPFRDAYTWIDGLFTAKSDAERLREENQRLRQRLIQSTLLAEENAKLQALLDFRTGPRFPSDYDGLAASVVARPSEAFSRALVIAVGSDDGVRVDDPVVSGEGLVGVVSRVSGTSSRVTLLIDDVSAVSARDLDSGAMGIVRHGGAPGSMLIFDRVPKSEVVEKGDVVVTAGWRSRRLASLYPRGIPVGRVTSVGRSDTDVWTQVQIEPFVDFDSLDSVLVLVKKTAP